MAEVLSCADGVGNRTGSGPSACQSCWRRQTLACLPTVQRFRGSPAAAAGFVLGTRDLTSEQSSGPICVPNTPGRNPCASSRQPSKRGRVVLRMLGQSWLESSAGVSVLLPLGNRMGQSLSACQAVRWHANPCPPANLPHLTVWLPAARQLIVLKQNDSSRQATFFNLGQLLQQVGQVKPAPLLDAWPWCTLCLALGVVCVWLQCWQLCMARPYARTGRLWRASWTTGRRGTAFSRLLSRPAP